MEGVVWCPLANARRRLTIDCERGSNEHQMINAYFGALQASRIQTKEYADTAQRNYVPVVVYESRPHLEGLGCVL
jgi:hypothetical protein